MLPILTIHRKLGGAPSRKLGRIRLPIPEGPEQRTRFLDPVTCLGALASAATVVGFFVVILQLRQNSKLLKNSALQVQQGYDALIKEEIRVLRTGWSSLEVTTRRVPDPKDPSREVVDAKGLYLALTNVGRLPITVIELGYQLKGRQITCETLAWIRVADATNEIHEGPFFLEPGQAVIVGAVFREDD